jgi:hypothetical protein
VCVGLYSLLSLYLAQRISDSEQRTVLFILAIFIPVETCSLPWFSNSRTIARVGLVVFLCSIVVRHVVCNRQREDTNRNRSLLSCCPHAQLGGSEAIIQSELTGNLESKTLQGSIEFGGQGFFAYSAYQNLQVEPSSIHTPIGAKALCQTHAPTGTRGNARLTNCCFAGTQAPCCKIRCGQRSPSMLRRMQ